MFPGTYWAACCVGCKAGIDIISLSQESKPDRLICDSSIFRDENIASLPVFNELVSVEIGDSLILNP
jgi:hypothetical protein